MSGNRYGRISSILVIFFFLLHGCGSDVEDADVESEKYQKAVSDFYVSLAASQTDEARFAFNKMNDVAQAYPDEPAAWTNLGVYAMRQGNFELAAERLRQARELKPDHPDILFLSGLLESRTGDTGEAIEYYRRASQASPDNLMIRYAHVLELEREDDVVHADEILALLIQMHESQPENQVVIFEMARVAAKERNRALLEESLDKLSAFSDYWNSEAAGQFEIVSEAVETEDFSSVSLELSFLRNGIEPSPAFQEDLRQIQLAPNEVGYLITEFQSLPRPEFRAAAPDQGITFSIADNGDFPERASFVKSVTLLEDLPPIAVYMTDSELHIDSEVVLAYPGDPDGRPISGSALAEIDYNYNFLNDLALAGNRGFKLYRQNDDYSFTDITPTLDISENITEASYRGIWAADIDQDGDLDLLLSPSNGQPLVLRNNADGTFTPVELFQDVGNVVDFRWADLDGDGAADALFLTEDGEVVVYRNHRGGEFVKSDRLPIDNDVSAISIADTNADGLFDILTVGNNFMISRLFYERRNDSWTHEVIVSDGNDLSQTSIQPGSVSLFVPDIDNNGVLDLLISTPETSRIWLGDSNFSYQLLDHELPGGVVSVFDIDGNERLDLLGIRPGGDTFKLMNSGTMDYGARSIRARASGLEGDQRINSFGIGGEMEIRSGLLYQKQLISSPIVHFGLGNYTEAEMLRIIWPNGSVQAEFAELGIGATIFNEQILKGSCPWLFTHDGERVQFITDALWRSPLGLRINAQETAGIIQTFDRVKIPGEMLANREGIYDVRITAELWETHFFDYVDLVTIDHPENTEIFVDERFVFPAPELSTRLVKTPQPVASVLDRNGRDVSEIVSRKDGSYLKPFQKTSYQGLVEDHFIEINIGETAPADTPLVLVASGWLRPTDSSINLALSQGSIEPPKGLKIEVPDGEGGWEILHDDYGVPAGKLKTILLDLDEDTFPDPGDRRIRMHTTSEIYWDAIQWAERLPEEKAIERSVSPLKQELRYRGFSEWHRPDNVSPKLPNYGEISSTAQRWRDLMGYHTRFGDVSELLADIDDRYVIMNAGDEMILEFEALNEPEEGWNRSFVFVSDGWVKDGDYNTEASKTVEPLPYHGQTDYDYLQNGTLFDDPVFQMHQSDWIDYHTRYITPEPFRSALIFDKNR